MARAAHSFKIVGPPPAVRLPLQVTRRAPYSSTMNDDAPDKLHPKPPTPAPKTDEAGRTREVGGPKGPEPTRYGDWQFNGRCTDF